MGCFSQKVAMVTGGASGIGLAVSRALAFRGCSVVLADLDGERARHEVAALGARGGAVGARLDVTDLESVKLLVERVRADRGRLDYIFNNAGVNVMGLAQEMSDDDWRRVLDVNLTGVVNGVIAAYPVMVDQGFGHIVNVSSLGGLVPVPLEAAYTASKHGVVGLSNALRIEAERFGVKVTVVCPGQVRTSIHDSSKIIGFDRDRMPDVRRVGTTPEKAAERILRGVERNRATVVVPRRSASLWLLDRLSPTLARRLMGLGMDRMMKARLD